MELVAGQPYLTQMLLAAADRGVDDADRERRFEHAVRALEAERNPHVTYLFQLIKSDSGLVQIVRELLRTEDGIRTESVTPIATLPWSAVLRAFVTVCSKFPQQIVRLC